MANASSKHGMGSGRVQGHQTAGSADPDTLDETDLASDIHGANGLQGNDQSSVRNERQAQPGSNDLRNLPEGMSREPRRG